MNLKINNLDELPLFGSDNMLSPSFEGLIKSIFNNFLISRISRQEFIDQLIEISVYIEDHRVIVGFGE